MAAIYLGGGTVAASVPGLSDAFTVVGQALGDLKRVVEVQLGRVADLATALSANARAVASAKTAIRIPAVSDFQAQLDAALAISANFNAQLSNPAAYLQRLLDGLLSVQTNLSLVPPTVLLNVQLDASASTTVLFQAKIDAVDLELEALASIAAALTELARIAAEVSAALRAAISAVAAALRLYANLAEQLLAEGVHAFLYDGPLAGLGAAIDGVTPSAGISGSVPVRVPVVMVRQDNTAGLQGVNAVFRVI